MARTEPGSKMTVGGAAAVAVGLAATAVFRSISNQPAPTPEPGPEPPPVYISETDPPTPAPAVDGPVPECVPDEDGDTELTWAAKRRNCAYKQLFDCLTQTPTECASLQQAYDEADRAYKDLVAAEVPQQHSDARSGTGPGVEYDEKEVLEGGGLFD